MYQSLCCEILSIHTSFLLIARLSLNRNSGISANSGCVPQAPPAGASLNRVASVQLIAHASAEHCVIHAMQVNSVFS